MICQWEGGEAGEDEDGGGDRDGGGDEGSGTGRWDVLVLSAVLGGCWVSRALMQVAEQRRGSGWRLNWLKFSHGVRQKYHTGVQGLSECKMFAVASRAKLLASSSKTVASQARCTMDTQYF